MSVLNDVPVDCTIALGSTMLPIKQILKLSRGATIPLDCNEDDPTLIYINGQLIAKGQILVDGDKMLMEITTLVKPGR
ncbi:FliM/FliN family flagellar motor switch protein [Alteriqipengyuania lutimaris]|uniref:Flagellar motor switch protein FliN n=1 Tax=Alteriqipengyuania lutimaris TaxID=1538146 RepID=A0A395LMV8_9SPHN|nr:FliM/FliN family flagellar motor switch protein [Alteriqipengyuania lutimaris]MBB3032491.1 flagellar motor switch protein FliN/FliY [Alteriqipengyuania lutimaris]RDS78373.1 flagellar motor switch protein FliN [Alteriqipengyuania lutimaris]